MFFIYYKDGSSGKRDYTEPECSRLVLNYNVGANVELVWITQLAQDGSYHM